MPKKLYKFANNPDILIKPSDKNLGLTIISTSWYITEGENQLKDQKTYKYVNLSLQDITQSTLEKGEDLLRQLNGYRGGILQKYFTQLHSKYISTKINDAKLPKFHLIPKIHKQPVKGRPIIPSHSWITSPFSKWIDTILQLGLKHCPTVLKDSKELVNLLDQLQITDHIMATGDVSSMYTNIPTEEGINRVVGFLHLALQLDGKTSRLLKKVLKFIMDNNYFEFNGKYYLQINGTAMGTSCAPAYANIFMYTLERETLAITQPFFFKRYIDDLLLICLTKEQYDQTSEYFNKLHPDIQINWSYSNKEIDFLDLHIESSPYQFSTHQKALNQYLYVPFSSYHPLTNKKGFIKAELLRYIRNSSNQQLFEKTATQFFYRLRLRGYPPRLLRHIFGQVYYSNRPEYLKDKPPSVFNNKLIPFVTTFNPVWDNKSFSHTMKTFRNMFPKYSTVVAYRKNQNMLDIFQKLNANKLRKPKKFFLKRKTSQEPKQVKRFIKRRKKVEGNITLNQ